MLAVVTTRARSVNTAISSFGSFVSTITRCKYEPNRDALNVTVTGSDVLEANSRIGVVGAVHWQVDSSFLIIRGDPPAFCRENVEVTGRPNLTIPKSISAGTNRTCGPAFSHTSSRWPTENRNKPPAIIKATDDGESARFTGTKQKTPCLRPQPLLLPSLRERAYTMSATPKAF